MGLQNISPNNLKKNTYHKYFPLAGTDQCYSKLSQCIRFEKNIH